MPDVTIYFQDDLWNDLKAYKQHIDETAEGEVQIDALVRIAVRGFLAMAMGEDE